MFRFAEVRFDEGRTSFKGDAHVSFGLSVKDECGNEAGTVGGWTWDGTSLVACSDRHGYLPLYYHLDERSRHLMLSDSPLRLLAEGIGTEFDRESLAFFCRSGFVLGDRTLHRGVHRVPAGSMIRWQDGAFSVTEVEPRFNCSSPDSIEDALQGWIDRFQVAMQRRRPSGAFAMPLTGGRDSRMMLMELRRLGHDPVETVSFAPGVRGENEDLRIARTISERLGLRHVAARSDKGWLEVEKERHAWCGCEAIEHAWLMGLWGYMKAHHDCWYDGLGVGAMTRGELNTPDMLELLRANRLDEWCDAMYARTAAPSGSWGDRIAKVLDVELPGRDEIVDLVRQELARHLDAPNPLGRFSFCNWGRRSIALNPFGICRDAREVHTPFMDRDLVEWVAAVPAEWTFENDLQTTASRRLHPELADVEFDRHMPSRSRRIGMRRRLGNWIEKTRFFSGPGNRFRGLAGEAMKDIRRDPGANRALALMVQLVLADGARGTGRDRDLLSVIDGDGSVPRSVREAVA